MNISGCGLTRLFSICMHNKLQLASTTHRNQGVLFVICGFKCRYYRRSDVPTHKNEMKYNRKRHFKIQFVDRKYGTTFLLSLRRGF